MRKLLKEIGDWFKRLFNKLFGKKEQPTPEPIPEPIEDTRFNRERNNVVVHQSKEMTLFEFVDSMSIKLNGLSKKGYDYHFDMFVKIYNSGGFIMIQALAKQQLQFYDSLGVEL